MERGVFSVQAGSGCPARKCLGRREFAVCHIHGVDASKAKSPEMLLDLRMGFDSPIVTA